MVRNMGKGGKGHKKMKSSGLVEGERELVFKNYDQEYAMITQMLGHNRCMVRCFKDTVDKLGIIRGSMRRKQIHRIGKGDVVLVGLREFQMDKVDIIHVYNDSETSQLVAYEEIDQKFVASQNIVSSGCEQNNEYDIIFSEI